MSRNDEDEDFDDESLLDMLRCGSELEPSSTTATGMTTDDKTTAMPTASIPAAAASLSSVHHLDLSQVVLPLHQQQQHLPIGGSPRSQSGASTSSGLSLIANKHKDDVDGLLQLRRMSSEVVTEPKTGIRVSHPSVWYDQLGVILAQYTFIPISAVAPRLAPSTAALPNQQSTASEFCTIGVVTHKSSRMSSKSGKPFAMVDVWSLRGLNGGQSDRSNIEFISVFLGDAAFSEHYGRMSDGTVLLLCRLELMKALANNSGNGQRNPTLRCTDMQSIRVLGYAVDLKPCKGVNKSSNEACRILVNAAEVPYCAHHAVGQLKQTLFSGGSNKRAASAISGAGTGVLAQQHPPTSLLPRKTIVSLSPTAPTAVVKPSASSSKLMPYPTHHVLSAGAGPTPPRPALDPKMQNPLLHTATSSVAINLAMQMRQPMQKPERLSGGESFVAVRGGTVVNGSGASLMDERKPGGAYANVVRGPLEVSGVDRTVLASTDARTNTVTKQLPLVALGVTPHGRATLAAAIRTTDSEEKARELRRALVAPPLPPAAALSKKVLVPASGVKRPREELNAPGGTYGSDLRPVSAPSYFAPLQGPSRLDEDIGETRGGTARKASTLVSSGASTTAIMARALMKHRTGQATSQATSGDVKAGHIAIKSFLATSVDAVTSRNDDIREIAERQRLEATTNKLLEVDRALTALHKIHEQAVKAIHCRTCNRMYYRKPEACVQAGHAFVMCDTVRRYLECDHCKHKVTMLGDTNPSLLMPTCPQCKRTAIWNQSSAAPAHFTGQSRVVLREERDADGGHAYDAS